jgi:[ribosomal protein S5]-alanine N-acetyltransferase
MSSPLLATARLVLRSLREEDAPAVQRLLSTPHFAPHTVSFPYPYPPGAALAWIRQKHSREEAGLEHQWAITRPNGEFMGSIGIATRPETSTGHIGYWIGHDHWNRGYATEAARAVMEYGFGALGLARIEAMCFPGNPASARVLEKAGLVFEERREAHIIKDGQPRDVLVYSLSRPS